MRSVTLAVMRHALMANGFQDANDARNVLAVYEANQSVWEDDDGLSHHDYEDLDGH